MIKLRYSTRPLAAAIIVALSLGFAAAAAAGDIKTANGGAQDAPQTTTSNTSHKVSTPAAAGAKKKSQSAEQKQATELNAVNVTGIAGSQQKDIILKRYSDQIQDSITAQNIGQLPDTDVTDALQRITGVEINRSAGEGTSVSVRGISQVKTTMNGEEYLSAQGDNLYGDSALTSGANFVSVAATLVKGIDVIKSTTASNVAGGISGIINLNTYRPFDFKKGWTFSGATKGYEGDRVKTFNKDFSGLVSYHNEKWGALLEASYSDEKLNNDSPSLGNAGTKATEQQAGFDFNGDGVIGNNRNSSKIPRDYYYSFSPGFGNQTSQRKRAGLHGSFEYKFSDSLKLIGDADYSKYQVVNEYEGIGFSTANSTFVEPGAVITPYGVLESGTTGYAKLNQRSQADISTAKAINTNLELSYDGGGLFSGSVRWVHGHAFSNLEEAAIDSTPNRDSNIKLAGGGTRPYNPNGVPLTYANVNYTGKYPAFDVLTDLSNPKTWLAASSWGQANKIDVGSNIYRADGIFHFDSGVIDSLDVGARYQKKDFVYNAYKYLSPVSPAGSCADPTGPGPASPLYYFRDGQITDGCTGVSEAKGYNFTDLPSGYVNYLNNFNPLKVTGTGITKGFPGINPAAMTNPKAFLDSLSPGERLYQNPSSSYLVSEKIESAYAQLNLGGELPWTDTPWSGNIGMRGVRTTIGINSYITNASDYIGNAGSYNGVFVNQGIKTATQQYTTWLPAFNVAFDVTADQKLRLAASKTEARQDLGVLGQGFSESFYANGNPPRYPNQPQDLQIFNAASEGNAKLLPFESKNYNASYAWYFNPQSVAYLGAFLMQVGSFPLGATVHADLPDGDGVVRAGGPLTTYINGGAALIKGLEGDFRTQFTSLPGPLSGLGTELNYTYAKTGKTGLAHNQYNAIVFYQKYGLQVRLAYNWRGKNFQTTNSSLGDPLNIYSKPVGYLDASINYKINDNVSVFLQGTNLTDSFDNQYAQYPNAFYYQNISERRYYAGVRVGF